MDDGKRQNSLKIKAFSVCRYYIVTAFSRSTLNQHGVNPLIVKDRLGHEKIQTTLGTYGHLYPNSNFEVAKMLGGIINFTPATESIADYTHNQFTASYHRQI